MIKYLVSAALLVAASLLASPVLAQDRYDDRYDDRYRVDRDGDGRYDNDGRYYDDRRDGYRGDRTGVLRCESNHNRRTYCRTNGKHNVRILSQISNAPCYQNRSWGYNRKGMWVDHGCRADFRVYR